MGNVFRYIEYLYAGLRGVIAVAGFAAALSFLVPTGANAGGFALKEQSTAAQGNAFAGATAGAEDVTYMFYNPAGLTRHADNQAAITLNYFSVQGETVDADSGGTGEAASGDAAVDAPVPAAYGMWSISPDLKLGIGINAPYGLKTEYSQTWAGRYHAVESDMKTININPAIAYRINDVISVGVGLQIQKIDVTLSNMVDVFGTDLLAEVTGDDWGYGATVGLLAELSDDTRLGLGYRSQVKHDIEGSLSINGVLASDASADFTAPDMATAGIYHDINSQWAVMGELVWTRWSSFDELRVENSVGPNVTPEDWEDVWYLAVGATWRPNETWALRAGVGYDQSPIPDNRRTPRITDEDRIFVALGAQVRPTPTITIDAAYSHLFVKDGSIDLPAGYNGDPALPALTANYENSADIVSVQAVFHF